MAGKIVVSQHITDMGVEPIAAYDESNGAPLRPYRGTSLIRNRPPLLSLSRPTTSPAVHPWLWLRLCFIFFFITLEPRVE